MFYNVVIDVIYSNNVKMKIKIIIKQLRKHPIAVWGRVGWVGDMGRKNGGQDKGGGSTAIPRTTCDTPTSP